MMSLDESYKAAIVLHVYDLILKEVMKGKTFMQFAFDLNEVCHKQLSQDMLQPDSTLVDIQT
jgi:hypothetical protein